MVKFSKQMELQLVPEWRHKFCDYWQLKKGIKRIKLLKAAPPPPPPPAAAADGLVMQPDHAVVVAAASSSAAGVEHSVSISGGGSTWTPLSTFTRRPYNYMHPWTPHEDIIKVFERKTIVEEGGGCGLVYYQTQIPDGVVLVEPEKEFLRRLDEELNKVNHFFFSKEHEFLERAEILSRQLASLTEIHQAYNTTLDQDISLLDTKSSNNGLTHGPSYELLKPHPLNFLLKKVTNFKGLLSNTPSSMCVDKDMLRYKSGKHGAIDSEENSRHPLNRQRSQSEDDEVSCTTGHCTIDVTGKKDEDSISHCKSQKPTDEEEDWALADLFNPAQMKDCSSEEIPTCARVSISSLVNALLNQKIWDNAKKQEEEHQSKEILSRTRNIRKGALYTLASQSSFKEGMEHMKRSVSMRMRSEQLDENCVSLRKIKHARKMLRTAFVEFYRGLGLLQTFSSLNILAFSKILKKYDKVTGRQVSSTYMKVVEKTHFSTSDKVVKMMDEVEKLFTQRFAKDDEKKAMMLLKPVQNEAPHTVTFFLGLFSGSSIALLMAFVILLQTYKLHTLKENEATYFETTYQVFGLWPGCYF